MKDDSRVVDSSGGALGSRLIRTWNSIFIFLALALFGVGVALLAPSLLHGLSPLAFSTAALLLIYLPFRKLFTKRSKAFTAGAILSGILFILVFSKN